PVFSPAPSPTTVPLFASDEEAFDAALEVYEKYSLAIVEVNSGGVSADEARDRLSEGLTGEFLEASLEGFASFREQGERVTGQIVVEDAKLQQYDRHASGGSAVIIYVCSDVAGADVIDSSGN